jgi:hypothetical protein
MSSYKKRLRGKSETSNFKLHFGEDFVKISLEINVQAINFYLKNLPKQNAGLEITKR